MASPPATTPVIPPADPLSNLWERLSDVIRGRVSPDSFDRWFSNVTVTSITGDSVTLGVPNPIHQFFIESNYSSLLASALEEIHGAPRTLLLECTQDQADTRDNVADADDAATSVVSEKTSVTQSPKSSAIIPAATGMNPSYTFESFIVGANNQFAHAAS